MSSDLEANKQKMNKPVDMLQSIDLYFKRIDDCVQYGNDGKTSFSAKQILQTA